MKEIKEVLKACRRYRKFLITTHQNPDADAASSALAMAAFLKSLGKSVCVVNEDALPQWLMFLPQAKLFKRVRQLAAFEYDAAIVLDCGDRKRVGAAGKLFIEGRPVINIDHHITNDRFGDVNAVIGKASSTCEIIFELLKAAGYRMNKAMSMLLYAGIMTDTGSFRYENTGPRTHAIVAELMAFGLNAPDLYRRLYAGIPVRDLKLFTEVIHDAGLLLDGKVYCVCLPERTVAGFSRSFDLKERLFGFLRMIDGIEVVVILTQINSKETRVNLRSQGKFDVARLAQKFNGGGHMKAAGARIYDNLAAAKKQIIARITRQMKNGK